MFSNLFCYVSPLHVQLQIYNVCNESLTMWSKIEKVPRGIRGEKSSKERHGNFEKSGLNNWSISKSQNGGTEPGARKGKRSLLVYLTRCKCSIETTHNSVKVNVGIKVIKLVESLISWEVTVGQGSECHLTFVRGKLHIAE